MPSRPGLGETDFAPRAIVRTSCKTLRTIGALWACLLRARLNQAGLLILGQFRAGHHHETGFDSLDLWGLQCLTALMVDGFGDLSSVVLHKLNLRVHYFPEELGRGFGIDLESRLAG